LNLHEPVYHLFKAGPLSTYPGEIFCTEEEVLICCLLSMPVKLQDHEIAGKMLKVRHILLF